MEEMITLKNQKEPEYGWDVLVKWLKFLLAVQLTQLAVSIVAVLFLLIPVGGIRILADWVGKVLTLCMIMAMFRLSDANQRYRKAFIAHLIVAIGAIAESLTIGPGLALAVSLISLAGSIAGLVAVYQEYYGHGEIAEAAGDSNLSRKWNSLFVWQIVVGLVISLITVFSVMIGAAADAQMTRLVSILVPIAMIPGIILQIIYLRYLKKTLALIEA